MMRNFVIVLLVLISNGLQADVGRFDIIELSNGKNKLFTTIWSYGILKDHDLKYYNWNGEYLNDVSVNWEKSFWEMDSLELYSDLVTIDLTALDKEVDSDSVLFILQNMEEYSKNEILENYKIIDAYNGNTIGFTYTPGLSANDSIWINDYEIEILFEFHDYELCEMKLYGIKNNVTREEIEMLKSEIDDLLQQHEYDKFDKKLIQLRKRNIIMIGFCSC